MSMLSLCVYYDLYGLNQYLKALSSWYSWFRELFYLEFDLVTRLLILRLVASQSQVVSRNEWSVNLEG